MGRSIQIDTFSRFTQVSRETIDSLVKYENILIKSNEKLNLIGKSTINNIWSRHFLDSAQVIDFIDKNDVKICTDLGSGAGLPGIVLAILMKPKKPEFKVIFYEKSYHKSNFLKEISKKFKLNTEINQKNIFEQKDLRTDIIISRAFKPLPIIFEIAERNFKNFKHIILFLGRNGKKILHEAYRIWKFDCEEKKSLTSNDSLIVKISNLQKKNG